ncbi:hypothetical protein NIES593_17180 [Hydrococcus rivularis NIES-593]|uniref:SIMPL domain-containing protein n=1 Tax=Hydrococcus rivularis NIES-593 TaxID=1921803 RepID=A0A1U7HBT0_9CYAN|nr:SIMPL domain-containing protein [Hydrococcus rivularis]OKH20985.1 hypothetical protein NIES593_17180 [Hydrococcus rivularis NIES-593]
MNKELLSSQKLSSRWLLGKQAQAMAILLIIFSIASSAPAIAQEKILRILTVIGQGQETIPTSLAQVQLGVEVKGQTAQEVQQEIAKRSSAVVELLRSRGVEKLQTTGIQLQPAYDYSNNQQRLVGYVGVNTVSFRISNDKVGNLLDEAVKAGATRIDSVGFTASDNAIAAAQKQALRLATEDAQQQADTVLSALNLTRQEVVNIQVNGASTPPPQPLMAREAARTDSATTPVIGGEQTVSASVTLQIRY